VAKEGQGDLNDALFAMVQGAAREKVVAADALRGYEPGRQTSQQHTLRNMYSISRIQEVLQAVPRGAFDRIVCERGANRHVKKFGCWQHLVTMLYAQLSGAGSLRQIEAGLNSHRNHHYHLGIGNVRRTTLDDANRTRSPEVFARLLQVLIQQAGRSLRAEREELLYLLDATYCGNLKLHLLLDANGQAVADASITSATINDIVQAKQLGLQSGCTYVFDRGYCDYNWWHAIDQAGSRWVSRFKRDAAIAITRSHAVPSQDIDILSDCTVEFTLKRPRGGHRNLYTAPLRRIVVARDNAAPLVLATNDLQSPAAQIAALYKRRWQIELFFKWIKQHLQIRRFFGRNENAVRIQLLTALIAYMLVLLLKAVSGRPETLWMLLAQLRAGLFQRPRTEESYYRKRKRAQEELAAVQPSLIS
jgi:putative transposase